MVQMLVSKKLLGMMLLGGHEFGKHKVGHYTEAKLVKESCKVVGSNYSGMKELKHVISRRIKLVCS